MNVVFEAYFYVLIILGRNVRPLRLALNRSKTRHPQLLNEVMRKMNSKL